MYAMKKTIMTALCLVALTASAQYSITGDIKGLDGQMIILNMHGHDTDSARIVGGHFELRNPTHLRGADYVTLATADQKWGGMFWMQNDDIVIKSDGQTASIKGSKTQDEYEDYQNTMNVVWDKMRALQALVYDDVNKADSVDHVINTVWKSKADSTFLAWASRHPSSYIALNHIYNWRVMEKYPFEKYAEAAKLLTPGAFEGEQWETFQHLLKTDAAMQPGQPFPELIKPDVYGHDFDVASLRGKYVLVTLSCFGISDYNNDLALRRELYERYHDQGLEMVDDLWAEQVTDVIKAPANYGLRWHFISDLKGWSTPWVRLHEIDHLTQNFLIGPDGIIIGRQLFGDDLRREIEKLFN